MSTFDDAVKTADVTLSAVVNIVRAYDALSNDHAALLSRDFPTLSQALATLSQALKPLGITTPNAPAKPTA